MRFGSSFAVPLAAVLWAAPAAAPGVEGALASQERELQALFERVQPSVVLVSRKGGFGSGFFVRADGLVLTNAHVVAAAKQVDVVLPDGRRFQADVVERAADDVDLALVQVPVAHVRPLQLAALDDLRVGSFVASVGHGEGAIWTFNTGMVSNIYPVGAQRPVIQTQVPLQPGSSGAPLVDRAGRAVGIVTAGIREANAINFAIRADVAIRSLDRLAEMAGMLTVKAPPGVAVFVDGALAGSGPRFTLRLEPGPHEAMAVIGGRMQRRRIVFPETRSVGLE